MPDREGRAPVALLLCGHHLRAHGKALRKAGATLYDADGLPLPEDALSSPSVCRRGTRL